MEAIDIGKMVLDGNMVEIIMRELQINREQSIRLWYGSYTRNRVYATKINQIQTDAWLCFAELLREWGESCEEENTQ